MNSDTFFNDVILLGKTTIDNELRRHSDKFYNSEVVIDNETCYRIIIEWERCMGEILTQTSHMKTPREPCEI